MLSNKLKELLFDYFFLIAALVITSLFIKKLVADSSWLVLNIGLWIFIMIGTGLIMYDKYLLFILEIIIGIILAISFLIYKNNDISELISNSASNNISTEMAADPGSFHIIYGLLVLITIITIGAYFLINKLNFKTNVAEADKGLQGERGREGPSGDPSIPLDSPSNIAYENLRVMANDYFVKRKKQIMMTWDYNNRKQYYKEEMPLVFDFDERELQLRNISFYEILKRICYSNQFKYRLNLHREKIFDNKKKSVELSSNDELEFEYKTNIDYIALEILLSELEPSVYSAIDQICPNDLVFVQEDGTNDKHFLGIQFLDEDINYDHKFYDRVIQGSLAYNDNIWDWGKKECN